MPILPRIVKKVKGRRHYPKAPQLTHLQKITHKVVLAKKEWKIFEGDTVEVIAGDCKG